MPFNTDLSWIEDNEDIEGSPSATPVGESNRPYQELLENTLDNQSRIITLENSESVLSGASSLGRVTLEEYYQAISDLEDAKINYANVQGNNLLTGNGRLVPEYSNGGVSLSQTNQADWLGTNYIVSGFRLRSGIPETQDLIWPNLEFYNYCIGRLILRCNPSSLPIKIYLWNNVEESAAAPNYDPPQVFDYGIGHHEGNSTGTLLITMTNMFVANTSGISIRTELGSGASINSNFRIYMYIDGYF